MSVEIHSPFLGFRLPTEAEWECAARAGTTTEYYWGDDSIAYYTWYKGTPLPAGSKVVATKIPNALGLYDLSGNIGEWWGDWNGGYSDTLVIDPIGAATGSYRIV